MDLVGIKPTTSRLRRGALSCTSVEINQLSSLYFCMAFLPLPVILVVALHRAREIKSLGRLADSGKLPSGNFWRQAVQCVRRLPSLG